MTEMIAVSQDELLAALNGDARAQTHLRNKLVSVAVIRKIREPGYTPNINGMPNPANAPGRFADLRVESEPLLNKWVVRGGIAVLTVVICVALQWGWLW